MKKFEHEILEYTNDQWKVNYTSILGNFDHLGLKGWELITVVAAPGSCIRAIFKREINE